MIFEENSVNIFNSKIWLNMAFLPRNCVFRKRIPIFTSLSIKIFFCSKTIGKVLAVKDLSTLTVEESWALLRKTYTLFQ